MTGTFEIIQGDALERLKNWDYGPRDRLGNRTIFFDGCLCDPPYGYAAFQNRQKTERWEKEERPISFDPELWAGVYDRLAPGAFLLAATGPRTYHRIATAIEQAGFEIRDQFNWIYTQASATGVNEGWRLKPGVEPYVVARKPPIKGRSGLRGILNTKECMVNGHVPTNVAMDEMTAQLLDVAMGRPVANFFYCCKAPPSERRGNDHPTPKPLALCEYLGRLIHQPRAHRLLVPFSGVGSEMIGGLRADWDEVVGLEREVKYVRGAYRKIKQFAPDAKQRIYEQPKHRRAA